MYPTENPAGRYVGKLQQILRVPSQAEKNFFLSSFSSFCLYKKMDVSWTYSQYMKIKLCCCMP